MAQLEFLEKDSSTYLWGEIQKTQGSLDLVRKKAFAEICELRNIVVELKEKLNERPHLT